jgi:hypothetical protein
MEGGVRIEMQAISSNCVLFANFDFIFLPYEFTTKWDVQLVVIGK